MGEIQKEEYSVLAILDPEKLGKQFRDLLVLLYQDKSTPLSTFTKDIPIKVPEVHGSRKVGYRGEAQPLTHQD